MEATEDKAFILKDKKLRNIKDLSSAISELTDEEYNYYADANHNYFADWVLHVLGEKELSEKIRSAKSRNDAVEVLSPEIKTEEKSNIPEKKHEHIKNHKNQEEKKASSASLETVKTKTEEIKKEEEKKKTLAEIEGLKDEHEMKHYLWHHHPWEMAKEFMYGMSLGLVLGLILSRVLLP